MSSNNSSLSNLIITSQLSHWSSTDPTFPWTRSHFPPGNTPSSSPVPSPLCFPLNSRLLRAAVAQGSALRPLLSPHSLLRDPTQCHGFSVLCMLMAPTSEISVEAQVHVCSCLLLASQMSEKSTSMAESWPHKVFTVDTGDSARLPSPPSSHTHPTCPHICSDGSTFRSCSGPRWSSSLLHLARTLPWLTGVSTSGSPVDPHLHSPPHSSQLKSDHIPLLNKTLCHFPLDSEGKPTHSWGPARLYLICLPTAPNPKSTNFFPFTLPWTLLSYAIHL